MDEALVQHVVTGLRNAGARFGYVFGSQVTGRARPGSDLDVAGWFGHNVDEFALAARLGSGVDLTVLDRAPLELAGRVATGGQVIFDDDPPARVEWEATTRKIWLDERPRMDRARRDFVAGAQARGRS